jgi:hypothetical protein
MSSQPLELNPINLVIRCRLEIELEGGHLSMVPEILRETDLLASLGRGGNEPPRGLDLAMSHLNGENVVSAVPSPHLIFPASKV